MIKLSLLVLLCFFCFSAFAENITPDHPSPYVRMHVDDAVKWQRWDKSVLKRAKKENKLIVISSGYFACHWCHVMRKESFTDGEVATLLNQSFIAVKIDRELNPSLDAYLMEFIQHTQGFGGWPLNVFITPQGYPLTAVVYLPKDDLVSVLKKIKVKWQDQNAELKQIAQSAFEYSLNLNTRLITATDKELQVTLLAAVKQTADELEGGIGNQAKFPMPNLMLSLLLLYEKNKDQWLADFIKLSLHQMATNGLHDVIGGGFYRYTIDQGWRVPHFEKMLYTNAAMIKLYVKAFQVFGDRLWLQVAEETMEFVIREMRAADGAFVSTLNSQDVSGVEGGNYLWHQAELEQSLNKQQRKWVQKNVTYNALADTEKVLPVGFWSGADARKVKQVLLEKKRNNPVVKDDKFIASWNAYLLSAMIDVLGVKQNNQYKKVAQSLYKRLKQEVVEGLPRGGRGYSQKYLEDYAFVAYALWQWGELHGSKIDKPLVEKLMQNITELFVTQHGWHATDLSLLPMPGVQRNLKDGNLPSAEVVALKLAKRLNLKNNNKGMRKIKALPDGVDSRVVYKPLEYASYISAINLQLVPSQ